VGVGARTPADEVDPSSATTKVEFGVRLRALRTAAGLSLRELAAASKTNNSRSVVLSRSTIEDAELGRRPPRPDWLEAYLAACGVRGARQREWKGVRAALASPIVRDGELGRLPRIAASDPRQLGVHPAISVAAPGDRPGHGRRLPELPTYVPRDIDEQLREAIVDAAGHGGLVVLVGGSSTGKTRTAYEAVRAELPSWRLLHPADPAELATAVTARQLPRAGVVVWLDEAQHYLTGPDRLTTATARALLDPDQPMVLLATMWPQWYEQLTTPPPADVPPSDAEDIDPHRHARQILTTAARLIRLASFSQAECARAAALADEDPRLAAALRDSRYGPTEVLAGAPQLVERFEHAANPYAKAIMTAAIDYRRLGHNAALTAELLQSAAAGYLTGQQIATAPPEWFTTAIDCATRLLHGATSSLIPVPGTSMGTIIGYTVADYLLQHGQATRRDIPPPTSIWDAAVSHITDLPVRMALARAAERQNLYQPAVALAEPAADTGIPKAMLLLARSLEGLGQAQEAEQWCRRAADTGNSQAMFLLAGRLRRAGQAREAEQWYRQAATAGNPHAMLALAGWLADTGRGEEADQWYRLGAQTGNPHAMHALAGWLADAGRSTEAEEWYRHGAQTGDLNAMRALADWLAGAGRSTEAEEWYRHGAQTGDLNAMRALADWLAGAGRAPEAEEWYRRAADTGNPNAMRALARRLTDAGRAQEGEEWYRRGAQTGDPQAMLAFASWLASAGRAQEAQQWYGCAAETGDRDAMLAFASWLANAGQASEAEQWHQRAAETGDPHAMLALARQLRRTGRAQEAELWHRRAAETSNLHAMRTLASRLRDAGQAEEAEAWYRRGAEAGDHRAMWTLANWLPSAGQAGEAEQWHRRAAETGNPHAMLALARRLERAGQAGEAEQWHRRAARTGNPHAMLALAARLRRAERAEEAEHWYRRAAKAGELDAMLALGGRLRAAGQAEEAAVWYRRAADTGNPQGVRALADWLANTGHAQEG
jgi:TPR repeat protein/transcriptional regulator with XRE-family HTH domain